MAELIHVPAGLNRKEIYETLLPQIRALIEGEPDPVANIANIVAVLKSHLGFFWIGTYHVRTDHLGTQLVLGPFQGPVACTRIAFGKGVCGSAWKEAKSILVPDVNLFPGHIACSADSRSEIVIPFFKNAQVAGVLDIDSNLEADFDQTDEHYLREICNIIESCI